MRQIRVVRGVAFMLAGCVAGAAATAAPVVPQLRGIYDPGNGGPLQALWGYTNPNATAVTVPVGANNQFRTAPAFQGQPTQFAPGTVYGAFVTPFTTGPLMWTLKDGTQPALTATADVATGVKLPVDPAVLMGAGTIVPFVTKVWSDGPGDNWAEFGYGNGQSTTLNVPLGHNNWVDLGPNSGQPTSFLPGVVGSAFLVNFSEASVTWSVTAGGVTRSATAIAPPAMAIPEPGVGMLIAAGGMLMLGGRRR